MSKVLRKGVKLYREHGHEFGYDPEKDVWTIPGSQPGTFYEAKTNPRRCTCPSNRRCYHVVAALYAACENEFDSAKDFYRHDLDSPQGL